MSSECHLKKLSVDFFNIKFPTHGNIFQQDVNRQKIFSMCVFVIVLNAKDYLYSQSHACVIMTRSQSKQLFFSPYLFLSFFCALLKFLIVLCKFNFLLLLFAVIVTTLILVLLLYFRGV